MVKILLGSPFTGSRHNTGRCKLFSFLGACVCKSARRKNYLRGQNKTILYDYAVGL